MKERRHITITVESRKFEKLTKCSKIKTLPVLMAWKHMEWRYIPTHS